jgi:NTP pyrophosphatase (non-canonical NTP hydrolase)
MGDQFANFHAELSEAWECYRILSDVPAPFYIDGNTGKPEGIATELADCIIRILDTCKRYNWPLAQALLVKMEYNETRPYRHGNKLA